MTLFDPTPLGPATGHTAPDPVEPEATVEPTGEIELACRLTGCSRPLDAHTVTQARITNAQHPQTPKPARKRKTK